MPKSLTAAQKAAIARRHRKYPPRRRMYPLRRRMRIRRPLALKQHDFVERKTLDLVMQVDTEAAAIGMFKTFTLDELNNSSSYKDLFEYYKINKVVATFKYKSVGLPAYSTNAGGSTIINEINPILYFKVDHNDVASDPLITMQQSSRTRTKTLTNDNSEFSITLKPAVQTEAYKSALASTFMPKWGQWLSTDDASVPHYGLKAYAIGYRDPNVNPGKIQVEFKTYFSCKNNE